MIRLYLLALKNWSPSGRSSRSEFWSFMFVSFIVQVFLAASAFLLNAADALTTEQVLSRIYIGLVIIMIIALVLHSLAMAWLAMALCIRRWHDFGASAWLLIIYPIGTMLAAFVPPNLGPNKYGDQPGTSTVSDS